MAKKLSSFDIHIQQLWIWTNKLHHDHARRGCVSCRRCSCIYLMGVILGMKCHIQTSHSGSGKGKTFIPVKNGTFIFL